MGKRALGLLTATLITAGCGAAEKEVIPASTLPGIEVDSTDNMGTNPTESTATTSTTVGAVAVERLIENDPDDNTTTTVAPCVGICGPATVNEQAVRIGNQTQISTTTSPDYIPGSEDDPNCSRQAIYDDNGSIVAVVIVCN